LIPSVAVATAIIAGCSEGLRAGNEVNKATENFEFTPDERRKYPQVADADAPTVAELKRRGLVQTDWDADMYSCGPACDAVYAYAIFMGRRNRYPAQNEHLFTCPNPETAGDVDQWRCVPFSGKRGRPVA
jgi:hypothetical protein